MRNVILICAFVAVVSCKKESEENFGKPTATAQAPESLGKEIFEGKGVCYTCHKPEVKTVGPAIKDIAKMYKAKGASISEFLQEKSEPIVDPSQYETMKTNFAITKNMTEEERKALEAYMLSF